MAEVSVGTVGTQTDNNNFGIINLQKTKKKPYDVAIDNFKKELKIIPNVKYTAKQRYRRYKTNDAPKLYKRVMIDEEDEMVNKIREAFGLNAIKKNKNYQEVETAPTPYYNAPQPETVFENRNKEDDITDILADDMEALTLQAVPRRAMQRQGEEIEETQEQKQFYYAKNVLTELISNYQNYSKASITNFMNENMQLIRRNPELKGMFNYLRQTIEEDKIKQTAENAMRERAKKLQETPAATSNDPFRFAAAAFEEIERNAAKVKQIKNRVKSFEKYPNASIGNYQTAASSREIDDALSEISTRPQGIPNSLLSEYWDEINKKKGQPGRPKKPEKIEKEIADLFRKQKKRNEAANVKYIPKKYATTGYYEYFQ